MRYVQANLRNNQSGVVSMISVIFVSILLSLLAVGMVRLTSNEQRSATDLLLSSRALYAAESGIQDAIYDAKTGAPSTPGVCHTSANLNPTVSADSAYTCVIIGGGSTIEDTVSHNKSEALNLGSIPSAATLNFKWFIAGTDLPGAPPYNLSLFNGDKNPQCGTSYQTPSCASPPIIRLELIGMPTGGGPFNRNDIRRRVMMLRPSTGAGSPSATFGSNNMSDTADQYDSACDGTVPNGSYICDANINGFSGSYNYTLIVTPLYQQRDTITGKSGTHFRAEIVGGGGQLSGVVDVTARANDVFRRVIYRYSPTGTGIVPSFTLLSDTAFCKNPYVDSSDGRVVNSTDPITACRP